MIIPWSCHVCSREFERNGGGICRRCNKATCLRHLKLVGYTRKVNRYRRDKKTVSFDQPASDTETSWLDNMESSNPGPEAEFLQTELKDKLKEALDSLSEESATPIVLVDIGGFSYAEVAEIISCPIGTVRSRLFRARAVLAGKLREYVRHEK